MRILAFFTLEIARNAFQHWTPNSEEFYYPNVTTLRSGLSYRKTVCRLSVCRWSVTFVYPTWWLCKCW